MMNWYLDIINVCSHCAMLWLLYELTYSCNARLSITMPTVFLILLFKSITFDVTIASTNLLLLSLFLYYHHTAVTTDKLHRENFFSGVVELTTQLLRLINIICLPLCRINKFGFYFPRRLLWSPTLVGYKCSQWWILQEYKITLCLYITGYTKITKSCIFWRYESLYTQINTFVLLV